MSAQEIRAKALNWALWALLAIALVYGVVSCFVTIGPLTPGGYKIPETTITVPQIGSGWWFLLVPLIAFSLRECWGSNEMGGGIGWECYPAFISAVFLASGTFCHALSNPYKLEALLAVPAVAFYALVVVALCCCSISLVVAVFERLFSKAFWHGLGHGLNTMVSGAPEKKPPNNPN